MTDKPNAELLPKTKKIMKSIKIEKRYFKKTAAKAFAAKLRKDLKIEFPNREFKVEVAQAFQYPSIKNELGAPVNGDFIIVTTFPDAKPAEIAQPQPTLQAKVIKMRPVLSPKCTSKVRYILEEITYQLYSRIELARVYYKHLLSAA